MYTFVILCLVIIFFLTLCVYIFCRYFVHTVVVVYCFLIMYSALRSSFYAFYKCVFIIIINKCFKIEGHQGKVKGHGSNYLGGLPLIPALLMWYILVYNLQSHLILYKYWPSLIDQFCPFLLSICAFLFSLWSLVSYSQSLQAYRYLYWKLKKYNKKCDWFILFNMMPWLFNLMAFAHFKDVCWPLWPKNTIQILESYRDHLKTN